MYIYIKFSIHYIHQMHQVDVVSILNVHVIKNDIRIYLASIQG